jgi:hypothetical protein
MKKMFAVLALLFATSLIVTAQSTTTYSSNTPFYCQPSSAQPIQSFQLFNCRGITYKNADGTTALEYFFSGYPNWFELWQPTFFGQAQQSVTLVDFTLPNPVRPQPGVVTTPGTFAFNWALTDANGASHTGSVSGTWVNHQQCGGRGCYWWQPELLSNSITIQ